MIRLTTRLPFVAAFLPFSLMPDNDQTNEVPSPQNLTGKDRLKLMFTTDEFGNLSPQMHSCLQVGFLGLFTGACIGGFLQSRLAYMNFMENNQATVFKTHLDAKRKLQDQVTLGFAKGAYQVGWRLGGFSTVYMLITTSMSVYRGEPHIIDYITGAAVTGGLYKFKEGPRASLVGLGLGAVLGCICGGMSIGLLALSGKSMNEIHDWQYRWKAKRIFVQQKTMGAQRDANPLLEDVMRDKSIEQQKPVEK